MRCWCKCRARVIPQARRPCQDGQETIANAALHQPRQRPSRRCARPSRAPTEGGAVWEAGSSFSEGAVARCTVARIAWKCLGCLPEIIFNHSQAGDLFANPLVPRIRSGDAFTRFGILQKPLRSRPTDRYRAGCAGCRSRVQHCRGSGRRSNGRPEDLERPPPAAFWLYPWGTSRSSYEVNIRRTITASASSMARSPVLTMPLAVISRTTR